MTSTPVKREFLGHLHAFRAVAICFIVSGHALDAFSWQGAEAFHEVLRAFVGNGSALFVFIAGYLFQHLSGRYHTLDYWKSKWRNVLAPYLIVSVPALALVATGIVVRWDVPVDFQAWSLWERLGWLVVTGRHLSPLWFIPMITVFYFAAPVLVWLDRHPSLYWLWPLLMLMTMFVGRGWAPQSFAHFLSFYVAGMACCHHRAVLDPVLRRPAVWGACLAFALCMGAVQLSGLLPSLPSFAFNSWQKLALCLALLGALPAATGLTHSSLVGEVADLSFGVFFLHSYFVTGFKMGFGVLLGGAPAGNVLEWAVLAAVVLAACMLVLRAVKRLAGANSRWLVGC